MDRPLDVMRAIELVRRWVVIVIACVVAGGAISLIAPVAIGPTFTATALLAVAEVEDNASGRAADDAVDTQITILQSPIFMERAFNALSLDDRLKEAVPRLSDMERRLKIIQELRSRLIAVSFSAKSPGVAADVANTIARLYVEDPVLQGVQSVDDANRQFDLRIRTLEEQLQRAENETASKQQGVSPSSEPSSAEALALRDQIASLKLSQTLAHRMQENRLQTLAMSPPVQLVALATPPTRRSSINPILIAIPGTLFSAIFGVAAAMLAGRLDKRIYSLSELIDGTGILCAGGVPRRRHRTILGRGKDPDLRLGYRRAIEAVVTETLLLKPPQRRTILVTASDVGDSSPEFARSLAAAAARLRRRVLLVDIDVTSPARRTSTIRGAFGHDGSASSGDIFDVLADRCPPAAAIRRLPEKNLYVLPVAQNRDADALALIASGQLKQLLAELRGEYDWIVLAGPPVIGVNETKIIATVVDAAMLTVKSGVSTLPEVRDALNALSSSMAFGGLADVSSGLFTVLIDAPEGNLPARLRDAGTAKPVSPTPAPGVAETLPLSPAENRSEQETSLNQLFSSSGPSS
jgi:Mrp family chromosome partitioning ATPase